MIANIREYNYPCLLYQNPLNSYFKKRITFSHKNLQRIVHKYGKYIRNLYLLIFNIYAIYIYIIFITRKKVRH